MLDVISITFPLIFIGLIIASFYNIVYLYLLIAIFIFDVLAYAIKVAFGNKGPCARPKGACQCDILGLSHDDAGKPGFPSGHVATTTMVVIGLFHITKSPIIAIIGLIYIVLMAISRFRMRCHTPLQILAGFVLGSLGGLAWGCIPIP
jgi:membrane-associated phospholipid phosphatase